MKLELIGEARVVMSNPHSLHNYFAWPTITRLQNGRLAVVASGYRLRHVCPFGKMVISYSEDEGETYTSPAPIIDTPLDDRDGGILAFDECGVIVTSFNNTVTMQRNRREATPYSQAYLDTVPPEAEERYLGSTFRISHDCGVTFGEIHKSPITSPHGPTQLADGTILWVGRTYDTAHEPDEISAYVVDPASGDMTLLGKIPAIPAEEETYETCEPHAILLPSGRIIAHIRVHTVPSGSRQPSGITLYQSESDDGGRTWTQPHALLGRTGGAPPHLLLHSSGVLISTYACRAEPFSIYAMISRDGGATWQTDLLLHENGVSADLGYPATVELRDGSLLTVFYAHPTKDSPAVILQQKWRLAD